MKAKIVISKDCAESQALKYELLGGFQRTEECEMVCPITILFSIVLMTFLFQNHRLNHLPCNMHIKVSDLPTDNSVFQSQKFIIACAFSTVHRNFHSCSFEVLALLTSIGCKWIF